MIKLGSLLNGSKWYESVLPPYYEWLRSTGYHRAPRKFKKAYKKKYKEQHRRPHLWGGSAVYGNNDIVHTLSGGYGSTYIHSFMPCFDPIL